MGPPLKHPGAGCQKQDQDPLKRSVFLRSLQLMAHNRFMQGQPWNEEREKPSFGLLRSIFSKAQETLSESPRHPPASSPDKNPAPRKRLATPIDSSAERTIIWALGFSFLSRGISRRP